ncbi:MAG: asparaginase [Rhizobiaceae bacterium]|nr:asparaginase [Rhizobiaceae bacterium]
MNTNPISAELTRGGIVESFHRAACSIVHCEDGVVSNFGDVARPIFPRSAIKALQALPMIECGAGKAFNLSPAQIALTCASHLGEPVHVEGVLSILKKADIDEKHLDCGWHWPSDKKSASQLAVNGAKPRSVHNNCSGKHAGMLLTAKYLNEPLENYTDRSHRVQQRIEAVISEFCDCELVSAPCGSDGCSVPTWATPLENLALGFSNLARPPKKLARWQESSEIIIKAVKKQPYMIAGNNSFCTKIMQSIPRLFAKNGAEGVFCGSVPHAGIGIAVKCDDGGERAAQVIFANALASLSIWSREEKESLIAFSRDDIKNRNGIITGEIRAC